MDEFIKTTILLAFRFVLFKLIKVGNNRKMILAKVTVIVDVNNKNVYFGIYQKEYQWEYQ